MRVSFSRLISLIVISIICIAYSIYLGSTIEEKVIVGIALLILPIISLILLFAEGRLWRKIVYIILMILTIIVILFFMIIIIFTGTFEVSAGLNYKTIGMITLVFSPLVVSYIYLAYLQYKESKGKYFGRRRNLF